MLTAGSAELIFPFPGLQNNESVRTLAFLDVANAFAKGNFNSSDLRASAGLSLAWLTPIGPLTLVVARPLSKQPSDTTENVHVSLGHSY